MALMDGQSLRGLKRPGVISGFVVDWEGSTFPQYGADESREVASATATHAGAMHESFSRPGGHFVR